MSSLQKVLGKEEVYGVSEDTQTVHVHAVVSRCSAWQVSIPVLIDILQIRSVYFKLGKQNTGEKIRSKVQETQVQTGRIQ